jgi:hypothetical protein
MQKSIKVSLIGIIFLLCANFGTDDTSIAGREKPRINFYGTLTDTSGRKYNVENITISGMYKQIPFYQKPTSKEIDPHINITRLDFAEVYSISVPHPNTLLNFNNHEYIEIEITSKDPKHTKETYIIEKSKRVICDQVNNAGPIEKELAFQAVDVLIFEGHKPAAPPEDLKKSAPVKNR